MSGAALAETVHGSDEPDELLTVKELAALVDVSRWTITRWRREGLLHGERVGHRWRFPRHRALEEIRGLACES